MYAGGYTEKGILIITIARRSPMMNGVALQMLIGYHQSRNRMLWDAIEALGATAFDAPAHYSVGNIRNHMVHLSYVDAAWLHGMRGLPRDTFAWLDIARYAEVYPTIAHAKAFHDAVAQDLWTRLITWTDADLLVFPPGMNEARWQILTHLVTHGVDHRAQVLHQIHACGGQTFPQDLIMYLWEQAKQ